MGGILAVITAILYSTVYRKSYRKLSYGLQTEKGGVAWKDLQIPGLLFIVIVVFGLIFFN
jgi:hypothetical protein